jgi:ArsR family transcriptional regulator, cadmium/lead-responsive transcriptional repressor
MSQHSPEPHQDQPASGEDEQLWAAVAEPGRRRLLDLLLAHGHATPTSLAAELPLTRQAASKHLAVLARAGLVQAHRHGREVHYTVSVQRLAAAAQAMTQAAAQWDRRLQTIKRLAETVHRENRRNTHQIEP